ncbi:LamG domain-containing protein [Metabacillus halosaccharovorans]|uniref:LamG domain-containing protein n=1 Tax=Metabacillus halosaccharovorans TaxID=930124 RepID=UPI001C1F2107|nr:LamG domain-containing protein [Metabacillus halosaccharovorans]MBU7591693.1 LamG domain-containing protein [Metabacillus halosaccharovorans]
MANQEFGLIDNDSYSVALWLNPDVLTEYSTVFFGARDSNHWISLVPKGHSGVSHHTMVWSGTYWWDTPYKGLMDELRIYRGSISADEIVELAKTK